MNRIPPSAEDYLNTTETLRTQRKELAELALCDSVHSEPLWWVGAFRPGGKEIEQATMLENLELLFQG